MYFGSRDYKHTKKSYLSFCDGVGVVLAAKFNKIQIDRYNGPDFDYGLRAIQAGFKCYTTRKYIGIRELNEDISSWCNPKISMLKLLSYFILQVA